MTQAVLTSPTLSVHSPYDGRLIGQVQIPDQATVERAVTAAHNCRAELAALPAHRRASALDSVSSGLSARAEELAQLITAENGKPLRWARTEVTRAAATFRWAAEEARRWSGELQRLDTDAGSEGRLALVRRVPRGPVLGITPFNFPLNLVVHKIAPALAVGCPIVLKPAPATPLTSLVLGELLGQTDLPDGAWSVLPVGNHAAARLVRDPRLPVVSFTGSGPVGWGIRDAVPRKHVTLELGGNAAVIVAPDYDDLAWAAQRIATFAMAQAGQSCVSVQRVLCVAERYDELRGRVVALVQALGTGDPADPTTEVGPLIDTAAAQRVQGWVQQAVDSGARLLCGGVRDGSSYTPTVLEDVAAGSRVLDDEVFGPVLVLQRVATVQEAFDLVNASRFGLQTGVFTRDLTLAFRAAHDLDVGGVIIGDVPSYRADQMPYGGVKDSGRGREGVLSAMHDLTEQKVLVLTGVTL